MLPVFSLVEIKCFYHAQANEGNHYRTKNAYKQRSRTEFPNMPEVSAKAYSYHSH